jgi:hypothetical protein
MVEHQGGLPMRKRIADALLRREVAGVILLFLIPAVFLNDLGRPAFLGYYLGVGATWIAYVIGLRRQVLVPSSK